MKRPIVEVEKSVEHYVMSIQVAKITKHNVVLRLANGVEHTLYRGDHLTMRWRDDELHDLSGDDQ